MIFNLHRNQGQVENHELKIIGGNPGNDFQPTLNQGQVENHQLKITADYT
jgi:hypothetical protein